MRLLFIYILLLPSLLFGQIVKDSDGILRYIPEEKGYSFKGNLTSCFVNINSAISAIQSKSSGKIEFYFKADNTLSGSVESLFTVNNDARTEFLYVQYQGTDGKIRVYFYDGTVNIIRTTASYNDNTWRKISLISNGSAWNIQINDVNEAFTVVSGSNNGAWFGDVSITYMSINATNFNTGTGQYAEAGVYDFIIYDTDNTTELARFPLSENGGDSAYDVSGNGNHGTVIAGCYIRTDENTYNSDYGNTFVRYNYESAIVPYKSDSTELYSSVSPILNASEKTRDFAYSFYDSQYILSCDIYHVLIIGGQSNASGFNDLPVSDSLSDPDVWIANGTGIEKLDFSNNNNQYPVTSQLEDYSYQASLYDLYKKRKQKLIVIKYAVNSTTLFTAWGLGLTKNTDSLKNLITTTLSYLDANNYNYVIDGFLWYQGESDMQCEACANAYQTNLGNLTTSIRGVTVPNLRFVTIRPHNINSGYTYYDTVRTAISNYVDSDNNARMVDVDDVSDRLHPTAIECVTIADRVFTNIYN